MNSKQYNNVIDYTLKHEQCEDSLGTARAIFNNMGVALPQGDLAEVKETLETNDYMGWQSCTMEEAQAAADSGVAAIGISDERIVVLSANDEEQPVAEAASVMSISENTTEIATAGMDYYVYNNSTQMNMYFENNSLAVDEGWAGYNTLYGATTSTIYWTSSNPSVASVGYYSGYVTTNKPGSAVITAIDSGNGNRCAIFSIWVRGKTPVFLIHGRTSNSFVTWGAGNRIFVNPMDTSEADNNHYNSSINALSQGNVQYLYTNKNVQDIFGYQTGQTIKVDGTNVANFTMPGVFNGQFDDGKYTSKHPEGGNLAFYLKNNGYKENINLFVFNYPNEDAVVHSAKKFEKYIENLVSYVRTSGTDEMKACFYASWADYNANNYKINLVGHSMGGLVCRYYIENLRHDENVDKLITICTPHWGSGYADTSCITSASHKLCDHDLRTNSKMYGGSFSTDLDCNAYFGSNPCHSGSYTLTEELQYSNSRSTKYYAIAGIDYNATMIGSNDHPFQMPVNFNTYQQVIDYMTEKSVYKWNLIDGIEPINVKTVGDNMVGFLSQIGWTENLGDTPLKRIQMEKIFVNVDANGGNGDGIPGLEILNMLHSKMQHRTCIMSKVYSYLTE